MTFPTCGLWIKPGDILVSRYQYQSKKIIVIIKVCPVDGQPLVKAHVLYSGETVIKDYHFSRNADTLEWKIIDG